MRVKYLAQEHNTMIPTREIKFQSSRLFFSVFSEGYFKSRVCEHRQMTINCGSKFINILDASYGLTQHWVCEYGRDTNCHAGISMRVVKHECQGQPKCTLRAINSVFGDPCRGAYKYLEVGSKLNFATSAFG